jgi:hypothetical protein
MNNIKDRLNEALKAHNMTPAVQALGGFYILVSGNFRATF